MARKTLPIDFALQGGGSHGAFAWGVLDRFLDEEYFDIQGIAGTSAGSMNAAAFASGYALGGKEGARGSLDHFWKAVSDAAIFSPFKRSALDIIQGKWTLSNSPFFLMAELSSRLMSPYDNPFRGENPLKSILEGSIDFDAIQEGPVKLFINATNVRTGRGRVFRTKEVTPEVLMASACLPTLFPAVEIDGEAYWDGGYSGNPMLTSLIRECDSMDTVLVQINPVERPGIPKTAGEIMNRLNEISFNSSLLKELRMLSLIADAIPDSEQMGESGLYGGQRIHLIGNEVMVDLGYSSKLNAEWKFLTMLKEEGRKSADSFLKADGDKLGKRSTFDKSALQEGIDYV
jgi:NTE family protein